MQRQYTSLLRTRWPANSLGSRCKSRLLWGWYFYLGRIKGFFLAFLSFLCYIENLDILNDVQRGHKHNETALFSKLGHFNVLLLLKKIAERCVYFPGYTGAHIYLSIYHDIWVRYLNLNVACTIVRRKYEKSGKLTVSSIDEKK